MNILWHSNAPWAATGYGVQTRIFAPRIKALGYGMTVSAFYGLESATIGWRDGIRVLGKGFDPYGMDVIAQHGAEAKADVCITLIDAWVMKPENITAKGMRWAPWFPVDHHDLPEPVHMKVRHAWAPITYSRSAQEIATGHGLSPYYVPHGVETGVYRPHEAEEVRGRLGFPKDKFVVGMVAANKGQPSRKAFPQQLEAFARFHRKHPDSVIYLHTHLGQELQGLDIARTCQAVGIPDEAVMVCDQYRNAMGYPDDVMARIYSSFDVLLSATMGEGFGVPIIEAQACGTPVIVGGWTAMPELVGAGWVAKNSYPFLTPQNAYQYLPDIDELVGLLEEAYQARGDKALRERARTFAMRYDADTVTAEYWAPTLAAMAERLEGGTGTPSIEVA